MNNQKIAYERGNAEGLGFSSLNKEGIKALRRMSLKYKREHGIHHNKHCTEEEWYKEIKDSLFAPEYEGRYWCYCKVALVYNR